MRVEGRGAWRGNGLVVILQTIKIFESLAAQWNQERTQIFLRAVLVKLFSVYLPLKLNFTYFLKNLVSYL